MGVVWGNKGSVHLEVALGLLGALERGELLGLDCEHKAEAEASAK